MIKKTMLYPTLIAQIKGSNDYPDLHGSVIFKQTQKGVLVTTEVYGLPYRNECNSYIFAFHIHSGESCTGNETDPFADANTHYNPKNCQHPYHAGDLPPLFGNHGYAYMSVLTDRFNVNEIIGKVIIIHRQSDDFKTQPSGNSGDKIACGKIKALK